jgi:alanyl-tRNA synthetase/misacylated tRNA(Ala) deacylase
VASASASHPDADTTLIQMVSSPAATAKDAGDRFRAGLEGGRVKGGGAKGRWQGRVGGKWGAREVGVLKEVLDAV